MSVFTNIADALAELQGIRLQTISASKALTKVAANLSDGGAAYYSRKLQAAEGEMTRRLGVFLEPTEIFPVTEPTDDEATALGDTPWALEPAYDMPEDFIGINVPGFLQLLQRPVSAVTSLRILNPFDGSLLLDVPTSWMRLDYKHGQLTVMPSGLGSSQPITLFQLQVYTLGVYYPNMIWVRYTAGLARNSQYVAEVQDLVLRLAVLRILEDQFLPQSGSISEDGLSRSISQDIGKHRQAAEANIADLRQSINGIMLGVL